MLILLQNVAAAEENVAATQEMRAAQAAMLLAVPSSSINFHLCCATNQPLRDNGGK